VLATTLLMVIGLALALTTTADVKVAANYSTADEARYAADAALERAVLELRPLADFTPAIAGVQQASWTDHAGGPVSLGDGAAIVPASVAHLANCGHADACLPAEMDAVTSDRPWGVNNPRWQVFASAPLSAVIPDLPAGIVLYTVVLVADDPAENDDSPSVDGDAGNPGAGIINVRAEAFGAGSTRAVVEATLVRSDPALAARVVSWRVVR
jgi:type IV pilus assembly PilX-like protein